MFVCIVSTNSELQKLVQEKDNHIAQLTRKQTHIVNGKLSIDFKLTINQ